MATNNSQIERIQSTISKSLHEHWRSFLAEGIVLFVLGLLAIMVPIVATVAVEIIVGSLILVSGVVGLISTFYMRTAPGFWWSLFSALIGTAAGIILLLWPLNGALSLTLILTVFLAFEGILSIMYALDHRRELSGRWVMMMLSGIVDLVLAGFIFSGLPGTAAWAIGLLVGINLVFGGSAVIAMALHARQQPNNAPSR
ncbi:MAG TPA: HdeD family acid-resistance protein [Steroidobacteraceae bacterium]|nr:HdeD family acid-resistance protein [Steroidobacteraceae bacterium]